MNQKIELCRKVCKLALNEGLRPFLSKTQEYGFFTNQEGSVVVNFQVEYCDIQFSGNYISEYSGSGWRNNDKNYSDYTMQQILDDHKVAPTWAIRGEHVKMCTLEDNLKRWPASGYTEVTESDVKEWKESEAVL